MKISRALITTIDDFFKRDPEMSRLVWLGLSLIIVPILPIVVVYRAKYEEPEKNPDYDPGYFERRDRERREREKAQ